jgi:hypothetical protein
MPAFECKPSISIDANGQEVVDYSNPTFSTRGGFQSDMADFSYNEVTGQSTHNTPIDPELQQTADNENDYFSALAEAFPLEQMEQYAVQNWLPQQLEQFNSLVDAGDYEQVNLALEQLRDEMLQSDFLTEETPASDADFSDEQVAEIEQMYPVSDLQDYLINNYDEDTVAQFDSIVEQGSIEQVQALYQSLYEDYLGE